MIWHIWRTVSSLATLQFFFPTQLLHPTQLSFPLIILLDVPYWLKRLSIIWEAGLNELPPQLWRHIQIELRVGGRCVAAAADVAPVRVGWKLLFASVLISSCILLITKRKTWRSSLCMRFLDQTKRRSRLQSKQNKWILLKSVEVCKNAQLFIAIFVYNTVKPALDRCINILLLFSL